MGSVVISPALRDIVHRPYSTMSQIDGVESRQSSSNLTSTSSHQSSSNLATPPPSRPESVPPPTLSSSTTSIPTSASTSALAQIQNDNHPSTAANNSRPVPSHITIQAPSESSSSMSERNQTPTGSARSTSNLTAQQEAEQYARAGFHSSPASPRLRPTHLSTASLGGSAATSPSRIRVRNLSHIQSFASEELLAGPRSGSGLQDVGRQYEISAMPVTDIIEMVAGLLTKITTTNDMQHEQLHRGVHPSDGGNGANGQASSVLAFHGKNVPSISILSYLSRIHKYCPTTYEVFLSLLVYFDRMTESVNKGFLQNLQRKSEQQPLKPETASAPASVSSIPVSIDRSRSSEDTPPSSIQTPDDTPVAPVPMPPSPPNDDMSQCFVVDSFNIHRLVIAGVTCASKFFSDVFYTNSRYAKVGGLPLPELNHLELQFLLLNDFRLAVPVEELEAYGTMLVEFYAREVVAQQQAHHQAMAQSLGSSVGSDGGVYMRPTSSRRQGM